MDHSEFVKANKEAQEEAEFQTRASQAMVDEYRHSVASLHREESFNDISKHAHVSNENVFDVRQRKELYDAIELAAKKEKAHDAELKNELAQSMRADYLHGIQEKQKHLQNPQ